MKFLRNFFGHLEKIGLNTGRFTLAERENCYKMMLLTGSKKAETLHFYEQAGYNSSDKTAFIQWIGVDR